MRTVVAALLATTWAVAGLAGEPPQEVTDAKIRLGVFHITLVGFEVELSASAVDAVATSASATERYAVVSSSEIKALLDHEARKQLLGCDDASCLAEIGLAVGVEFVVAGTASWLEDRMAVSLQLIDTRTAEAKQRVAFDWHGQQSGLTAALQVATQLLIIPEAERVAGGLRLSGLGPQAGVSVDGELRGSGPITVAELSMGVHELTVVAPEFEPYAASFGVLSGEMTHVSPDLARPTEAPLYKRWWFWTAVGAVVVGGTATAIVLASGDDSPPVTGVNFRTAVPGVVP